MQAGEAISPSDEEITQDEAANEARTLIVGSSSLAAYEILKTHDQALSGRDVSILLRNKKPTLHNMNLAFTSECDDGWRILRNIYGSELFSSKALESRAKMRETKVMEMVEYLASKLGSSLSLLVLEPLQIDTMVSDMYVEDDDGVFNQDKLNYLEQPIPPAPVAPAEIHQNLEPLHVHEMLKELKTLFAQQAEQELLQTTRDFHSCRQEEGHMGNTVNELHAMPKLHEQTLPKSNTPALHVIQAGKVQKGNKHKKSQSQTAAKGQNHGKGINKQAYAPKPKIPTPPKKENPTKDSICHECREIGHWKRNCPQYLAELIKKKKNTASGADGSGSKG
uniref:Zinc finger, CCHC-type n=1 Tax=Tanacetum cinerariifolium TaxID=118510 RepID=A0A6L2MWM1_TANCI|nr:zinc finger, CCHC-type [Tanacetum cinerariifolium]